LSLSLRGCFEFLLHGEEIDHRAVRAQSLLDFQRSMLAGEPTAGGTGSKIHRGPAGERTSSVTRAQSPSSFEGHDRPVKEPPLKDR
jgi:hypothetical protein